MQSWKKLRGSCEKGLPVRIRFWELGLYDKAHQGKARKPGKNL